MDRSLKWVSLWVIHFPPTIQRPFRYERLCVFYVMDPVQCLDPVFSALYTQKQTQHDCDLDTAVVKTDIE